MEGYKVCKKCSENTNHVRGFSGWDFFIICENCQSYDHYAVNDMQAQEGQGDPYWLYSSGEKGYSDYILNVKCLELEKAEEGWEGTSGKFYEKYDRIMHTAKNLLNNENNK